jgi:hypothetical protein
MYPSTDARQLSILLRISSELDIVGDVTATVESPADLLAWASLLPQPTVCAWRAHSGKRYLQATAAHDRLPVHGRITAVLSADQHSQFWNEALQDHELQPGEERLLRLTNLTRAWETMPLVPET